MALDPLSPDLLALSAAARALGQGRNGRPMSPTTVARWANVGLFGVRLETCHRGGIQFTSMDALRRFFADVEQARQPRVVGRHRKVKKVQPEPVPA